MGTLVLLRHGQSYTNSGRIMHSEEQNILTRKGIMDSVGAGFDFREQNPDLHFDHTYCSPLHRAMQTGLNFLSSFDNRPVDFNIVPEFIERRFGFDEFLTIKKMIAQYGQAQIDAWEHDLNARAGDERGETLQEVWDRVIPAYEKLILPKLQAGENVLLVCHYYIVKVMSSYFDHGVPDFCHTYDPKNCKPYVYQV